MPKKSPGIFTMERPRKSLTCDSADQRSDAVGETDDHGHGDEAHQRAQLQHPMRNNGTPDSAVAR